jgi:hypothetical protein
MLLLLISAACDWCEGPPKGKFFRGYVVWQEPSCGDAVSEYVFRTAHDAIRVALDVGPRGARESAPVLSRSRFRGAWPAAASGLICADQLFDV